MRSRHRQHGKAYDTAPDPPATDPTAMGLRNAAHRAAASNRRVQTRLRGLHKSFTKIAMG
jgi:hypothetical protein